jgi:hypothetical protein
MQAHSYRSSDGKEGRDQSGSLVHLLESANPLRDSSYSSQSRAESNAAGSTSSVMSRRTSNALEELQPFKAIRESVVRECSVEAFVYMNDELVLHTEIDSAFFFLLKIHQNYNLNFEDITWNVLHYVFSVNSSMYSVT